MDRWSESPTSSAAQPSSREIFQHVAQGVLRRLNLAVVGVWLLDGSARVLELRATAGFSDCLAAGLSRVPSGALPVGRVARGSSAMLSNDLCDDPEEATRRWARAQGLLSFVGCPLIVEGRVRGVLAGFDFVPVADAALEYLRAVAWPLAALTESAKTAPALPEWLGQTIDEPGSAADSGQPERSRGACVDCELEFVRSLG